MYQIILIIEYGGNVTPTRCRAYEAPRNGARHENGTVNYNASSPRTIMLSQCAFLVTMGVALIGVRLQRGSAKTTFAVQFSRACKHSDRDLALDRTDLSSEKHLVACNVKIPKRETAK